MRKALTRIIFIIVIFTFGMAGCGTVSMSTEQTIEKASVSDKNDPRYTERRISDDVKARGVDIWSDGTRLSGDLFYPAEIDADDKLPAIVLCHGWGGVRSHLNQAYAPVFAAAGYVVLTFDYRGWGDSDSRLVIKGKMPRPESKGEVTVRAQAIRELVDPFERIEDITNCIDFLSGESVVDPKRIGLWGTSFGGGNVVYVAAHDNRVMTVVAQVSGWGASENWPNKVYASRQAIRRARGEIDPVPQGIDQIQGLKGTPYLSRMMKYSAIESGKSLRIPILIIEVENEQYKDPRDPGKVIYNSLKEKVPAKYVIIPNLTHYQIYSVGRTKSLDLAIDWFDEHLDK